MTDADIHVGIQDDRAEEKTIIFSVGHRCTSASLIKEINMKFESYPFDWVVSKLEVVMHCLETKFKHYLNRSNYERIERSQTYNRVDNIKCHICYESITKNHYYDKFIKNGSTNNVSTYEHGLALTHHDILDNAQEGYFQRCVARFQRVLASPKRKFYLYTHPLLGEVDFARSHATILCLFLQFIDTMQKFTQNSYGIFFILVRDYDNPNTIEVMFQSDEAVVFIMHVNSKLVDGGGVYSGSFYNEQYTMLTTIERVIREQSAT